MRTSEILAKESAASSRTSSAEIDLDDFSKPSPKAEDDDLLGNLNFDDFNTPASNANAAPEDDLYAGL
jgi:hypothetical protein